MREGYTYVPVVIILATEDIDVQRRSRSHGERVENVREHFGGEVSDFFAFETEVGETVRASADVNHRPGQRLPSSSDMSLVVCDIRKNGGLTSSRGANPVPYRLIPRTSPKACLNTVPRAIALSCM